jgi:magnesium-transporting ATPase (P-type)
LRDRDLWRNLAILAVGVPLLFVNAVWAKPAFIVYSLTFVFFGILIPFGSRWFWGTMPLIVLVHLFIVFALVMADLKVPEIQGLPRILFGFLAVIVVVEWRLALWILDVSCPEER